jgi:hypothetical protein
MPAPGSAKPLRTPPAWLRALGAADLPETIEVRGQTCTRVRPFKHDFFAATGLYEGPPGRVVLKVGRTAPVFGLPLRWLGRRLMLREARFYELLHDLDGVPRFLGQIGPTGFAHAYVEGGPLVSRSQIGDEFVPALRRLIADVHARGVAYVDLNKPENVRVDERGRPCLIDFQISWRASRLGRALVVGWLVLRLLQRSDDYHFLKHVRRFRPDQLTDAERRRVEHPPLPIRLHRLVGRPFIQARRKVLVKLGARSPKGEDHETGSQGA